MLFNHGRECLAEFCHPQDIRIGQQGEKALVCLAGISGRGDKVVACQEAGACNGAQRQAAARLIFTGLSILAPDDEMIRIGVGIELLFPKSIGQGVEGVFRILDCIEGVARDAPPMGILIGEDRAIERLINMRSPMSSLRYAMPWL